jgi:hypothetical protein
MKAPTFRRRAALVAAIVAVATVGLLTACTSPSGAPNATPTVHVNGLPSGVQQATNVPTDVPNTPALRQNVTIDTCAAADGGWKAVGTAKNPGDKDATYAISVFFTTDHGTVLGTGATKVTVPAGKSGNWTVAAELTPAEKTVCVLRGVG